MLGGTMVNLTGPCFEPGMRVTCRSFSCFSLLSFTFYFCQLSSSLSRDLVTLVIIIILLNLTITIILNIMSRFNTRDADGTVVDQNRASCIMPPFTEAEVVSLSSYFIIVFVVIVIFVCVVIIYLL